VEVLKRADAGVKVPDLCREICVNSATFYKQRANFGGMDVSMMSRVKALEEKNQRLKKVYLETEIKAEIVSEALEKNVWSTPLLQAS
jgi:putative transposase